MQQARAGRRPYRSPERRERRNHTQQAILQAAEALFRERGYAATTVQAVADAAGVSLPTVYLYFASKTALIRRLAEVVTGAPDLDVAQVLSEREPGRQLQIGSRILRRLHQRSEVVADVLRSAAPTDAELAREWRRWQERHLQAVRVVARSLADRGLLREGLDATAATDIQYAIGGPDLYRLLVRERRWTPARYEAWLADTGRRLLLADGSAE